MTDNEIRPGAATHGPRAHWIAIAMVYLSVLTLSAGATSAAGLTLLGPSEKVCQLTGDVDWETGSPTAARTWSNYGLDAVDLGYPVDDGKSLVLLFGDSWPPPHGAGPAGEIPPDDAVGVTARSRAPAASTGCLDLKINDRAGEKVFMPATVIGTTVVKQGFFNVPSGGFSVKDRLFAFFWTNHCSSPAHLSANNADPLRRPVATPACPETDDRNSIGVGVLASSTDQGRTFRRLVSMPPGFVYATGVNASRDANLPAQQRLGVFVFGVPRYRASAPYLALAPERSLTDTSTWRFFDGLAADGSPTWLSAADWRRATMQRWTPPPAAEVTAPATDAERCIGEFSVTWNVPLQGWLMLYNCHSRIEARIAPAPWGPWSTPIAILSLQDHVACRLVMTRAGCGTRRDYWPHNHVQGGFVAGGFYAPYLLNRYTVATQGPSGDARASTIYWLVSSWNPYQVTVMKSRLQLK